MKKEIFDILSNLIGKWLNNIEEGCKAREKKARMLTSLLKTD